MISPLPAPLLAAGPPLPAATGDVVGGVPGQTETTEADFDRRWPEDWERCTSPAHEGRTVVHSVRYHRRPEVQAEEADAATPTPSTDNAH